MTGRRRLGTRDPGSRIRPSESRPRDSRVKSTRYPRARKRFGQHFLEPAWVTRLLEVVDPAPDDLFIEIGPGRGAVTLPLARRAARVIAIEIDRDLVAALEREAPTNVRLVQSDVLAVDLASLLSGHPGPARVIGNLPYNVASPILFRLLHTALEGRLFSDATLMLQREVADRLTAMPGGRDYGALSIQVQLLADVERLLSLPPGAFRPLPKVHSAVVRLRFRPPKVEVGSIDAFERLVRTVFRQRRKTLANALRPVADSLGCSAPDVLRRAHLDGARRPETLSVEDMARLARAVL